MFLFLTACLIDTDLYQSRKELLTDNDGDGFSALDGDCDDEDTTVHPEAQELCDELDNNCDGEVDEGVSEGTWYPDEDGDGFGAGTAFVACGVPPDAADNEDDCNDDDASIHPDAAETWYDGTDADCAGDSDYDADGDGVDSDEYGGGDCDDTASDRYPGAPEVWDNFGEDNDCDGDAADQIHQSLDEAHLVITCLLYTSDAADE